MTSAIVAPERVDQSRGHRWPQPSNGVELDAGAAVVAFRFGDMRALQALMQRFGGMMTCVARRYVRCQQDVEDAVQDAWLAFARAADGIETPEAIGGWLRVTTARAALAIAQRQARLVPTDFPFDTTVAAGEPEMNRLDGDEVQAVHDAVGRLGGSDRELIEMLFEGELSYAEIAAQTGRSVGWIGPTRQRVITKLRRDGSIRHLARCRAS